MADAKLILKMVDGAEVTTLQELRDHYDWRSLLDHYASGNLLTWLKVHGYSDKVEEVASLEPSTDHFEKVLCSVLEIPPFEKDACDGDSLEFGDEEGQCDCSENSRYDASSLWHHFEYELFPDAFYHAPWGMIIMENLETAGSDYIAYLLENHLKLYDIPDDLREQLIVTARDFDVQVEKKDELWYGIIKIPKATSEHQCCMIGLVISQDEKYKNYYTAEQTASGDFVLYGWTVAKGDLQRSSYMRVAKSETEIEEYMIHEMLSPKKK